MEWTFDGSPLLDTLPSSTPGFATLWWWALPVCVACSSVGMLTLKRAQVVSAPYALCVGYALEAVAFGVYPFALKVHTMRTVSTVWAASSTFTSLFGGWLFYGEIPSMTSLCGCGVVVAGVVMVVR